MHIVTGVLQSLRNTVIAGFVVFALLLVVYLALGGVIDHLFASTLLRWVHVGSGVMWIGLLWYFNFVQIPNMQKIPDDQKPAITKIIAPEALFWFRWSAMATIIAGILLATMEGYILDAYTLGIANGFAVEKNIILGIGMWMGTIMWFNVWFIIWPNQKIALGLVEAPAEDKPRAARMAMLFSRTNTLLSIPMLFAMVAAQNLAF